MYLGRVVMAPGTIASVGRGRSGRRRLSIALRSHCLILAKRLATVPPVRNGILLAVLTAALIWSSSAAAAPLLSISVPAETDGRPLEVGYTLTSTAGVSHVVMNVKDPGAVNWRDVRFPDYDPPSASGTLRNYLYEQPAPVIEGQWHVLVTAFDNANHVLEQVEGTTQLNWRSEIAVSAPVFDPIGLGQTSGTKRLRIENFLWGPLRVKSVSLPAGSELAIVDDGCSGTTFYGLDGCYVTLNFTPQTLGTHRMTLFVDANANTKEIYMLGTGLEVPGPEPTPTPPPQPQPQPKPVDPPELVFNSAPGRTSTRLLGLRLEHVPAASTVTVRCAKGCPAKALTKSGLSGTVSLRQFATRALKVGTTIRITLATPGPIMRTGTRKIRARREPKVTGTL